MLHGDKLKEALHLYQSGKVTKKELRIKTLKVRRIYCNWLYKFFSQNDWVFNIDTANAFIDSLRTNQDGSRALPSTIAMYIAKLRAFNQFCVEKGYLEENFCKWIAKPSEDETLPEPVHLSISITTFYQAIILGTTPSKFDRPVSIFAKEESRVALLFMFHTGVRRGTASALKGSDLHFDVETPYYVATMKGGKRISLPIPNDPILRNELYKRRQREKVFQVREEVTIHHLRKGLITQGVSKDIANKINNHSLRKAFAQERDRNGEPIQKIAKAMGDTVRTVEKYYLAHAVESLVPTVNNSRAISHGLHTQENVNNGLEKLRTIFNDGRYNGIRLIMKEDKIIYEIPLSIKGRKDLGTDS